MAGRTGKVTRVPAFWDASATRSSLCVVGAAAALGGGTFLSAGPRFRRLAKDYERLTETLEGMHYIAFSFLMLQKAAPLFCSELITRSNPVSAGAGGSPP